MAQNSSISVSSAAGHRLYLKYCASCHDANGEGQFHWQKPNQLGEFPAPPHNEQGHTWRHSDQDLFKMISEGWRDPFNRTTRLTMPPFKDILSRGEIDQVIAYLKSLWRPEQLEFQREQNTGQALPDGRPDEQSFATEVEE
jgi:mono/diheme cytochrome c family protein